MGFMSAITVVTLGFPLWATISPTSAGVGEPMERLLDAIAQVESRNKAESVGDGGKAVGLYQIHRSYWADATRILGVDWDYSEAADPEKARQAVRAYLCHYGSGKPLLELARIHNGGPRGYEKAATLAYARKIEQALREGVAAWTWAQAAFARK